MSSSTLVKQIAAGRRRPNMTRKEYFDHRFRVHGRLSDAVEDKNQKPHKYIQTQVFDSAFGSREGASLNANQNWCGRDDTTELFFRDWDHVISCFTCDYVKTTIEPDGPFFADFESSIILMANEKPVSIETRLSTRMSDASLDNGDATVAMYFISTPANDKEGQELETTLTPLLIEALEQYCQDDVYGLIANVGTVSDKFDLNSYFGGANMPQYAIVYKIFLKDPASVPVLRKSQKVFESKASQHINLHTSFVVFSQEALIMDIENNTRFSFDRQPVFSDLPGVSHLNH